MTYEKMMAFVKRQFENGKIDSFHVGCGDGGTRTITVSVGTNTRYFHFYSEEVVCDRLGLEYEPKLITSVPTHTLRLPPLDLISR